MACGLVTMELHRGDGSLGVALGVHAGLAMQSIAMLGSEEQSNAGCPPWPRWASSARSRSPSRITARTPSRWKHPARRDGEGWVLTGHKRWIGLGTVADLVIVWARNTEDGKVNAFVVEKGSPGYQAGYRAQVIEGKVSLRSIWQADIVLDDVRVPEQNRLPGARSFKDAGKILAPPGAPAPGRRWATPRRPMTRRCVTRCSGGSSASRWPASRSSSSGWCQCWPTGPRCSCTACRSGAWPRRAG
jgi:glutaryl-CoA dehydrogenase